MLDLEHFNPFWTWTPTLKHIHKLLFETYYPLWLWNTMLVAVAATILSIIASVLAAYAIVRLRYRGAQWVGGAIFLAYLVPPSILFIPLSTVVFQYGLFDTPFALILTYPTILIPFSTWLLMGYFKTIPFELEECALIDGASRWQILTKIVLPLAVPGPDLGLHLLLHAVLERVHLRAHLHLLDPEQDGAGRDRQRVRRRRHLSLGLADGRRAGRLAAAGGALRLLRRALRVGDDRRGQGIATTFPVCARVERRRRPKPADAAFLTAGLNRRLRAKTYPPLLLRGVVCGRIILEYGRWVESEGLTAGDSP